MTRRRRRTLSAFVAAVVAVALFAAGCTNGGGSGAQPSASPTPSVDPTASLPPVGVDCRDLATQGLTLRLPNAAGLLLAAVDLGSGPEGVVLAHQSDANMCQWLPYATLLAQQGYRVVAFDFAGFGASSPTKSKTYLEDIRTVVDYLRDHGTPRVVVVGASMGATMSIVAAAAITPPVQGVVAVSPPKQFDSVAADRAAPSLHVPALYIAGNADGDYAVYARQLEEATPTGLGDLLVVDSPEHGVALVGATTPAGTQVRSAIGTFLTANLRAPDTPTPTR
jgi:pimeloyl-ACP methyl ester carboxylesterase